MRAMSNATLIDPAFKLSDAFRFSGLAPTLGESL